MQYVKFKLSSGQAPPADNYSTGYTFQKDWIVWYGPDDTFPTVDPATETAYTYALMTESEIDEFNDLQYPTIDTTVTGGTGGTGYVSTGETAGTGGTGGKYTRDLCVNANNSFAINEYPDDKYSSVKAFNDLYDDADFFAAQVPQDGENWNESYIGYNFLKNACLDSSKAFSFGNYSDDYLPEYAFDEDYETLWASPNVSGTIKGIGYGFDQAKIIRSIMLYPVIVSSVTYGPTDFSIYGSNYAPIDITDGRNIATFHYDWTLYNYDEYHIFNFDNELAFKYYWLYIDNTLPELHSIRMCETHDDYNFRNINFLRIGCGKYPNKAPTKFELRCSYFPPKVISDGHLVKSFDYTDEESFWSNDDVKDFIVNENIYEYPYYWIDMLDNQDRYENIKQYYISEFEMRSATYTENYANTDVAQIFSYNGVENNRNNLLIDNGLTFSSPYPGFFGVELEHGACVSYNSARILVSGQIPQFPGTNVQYDNDLPWKRANAKTAYIGIYFNTETLVNKVRIRCINISTAPRYFAIRGSASGVTPSATAGDLLLTVDGRDDNYGFWSSNETKEFELLNVTEYQQYWIWIYAKDTDNQNIWDHEIVQIDWLTEERSYLIGKPYHFTTSNISQLDVSDVEKLTYGQILKSMCDDNVSLAWLYSTDGRVTWKKYTTEEPFLYLDGFAQVKVIRNDVNSYEIWADDNSNNIMQYYTAVDCFSFESQTSVVRYGLNEDGFDSSKSMYRYILKEDDLYRMWYSGYDGSIWRILYTTSEDGVNWNASELAFSINYLVSYDITYVFAPYIIKESDELYKMWFTGYNGYSHLLFYCTSEDGITWDNFELCINPGLTSTYYESGVRTPIILKESENEYRLYISAIATNGLYRILHFTSEDGINWTYDRIVIDAYANVDLYKTRLEVHTLLKDDDGIYRLWYGNTNTSHQIFYVESTDGFDFLTSHEQLVKLSEIIDDDVANNVLDNESLMSSDDLEDVIPQLDLTNTDTLDFFGIANSKYPTITPKVEKVICSSDSQENKFDYDNVAYSTVDDNKAASIQWKQANTSQITLNSYFTVTSNSGPLSNNVFINSGNVFVYNRRAGTNGPANIYFTLPKGAFVTAWGCSWANSSSKYSYNATIYLYHVRSGATIASGTINTYNRYPSSYFRFYFNANYSGWQGVGVYFYNFRMYGYMPSAVYYLALCRIRAAVYIADTPVVVFNSTQGKIDISSINVIDSFVFSYSQPTNTTIKCLLSFNNKVSWIRYNTETEVWESATYSDQDSWNTLDEITTGMVSYAVIDDDDISFAFLLSTSDSSTTPEIYSIDINDGEATLTFNDSELINCTQSLNNSIEVTSTGTRAAPVIAATEYSDNLCTTSSNGFGVNISNVAQCFDSNLSTEGYSTAYDLAIFGYTFPDRYCIRKVEMIVLTTAKGPNHFQIRASNTKPTTYQQGDLLYELNEATVNYWSSGVVKTYEFDNDMFYQYYWIECLDKFGSFGETYEYFICDIKMYSYLNEYFVRDIPHDSYIDPLAIVTTNNVSNLDSSDIDVLNKVKFNVECPPSTEVRILYSLDGRETWNRYEYKCCPIPILRRWRILEGMMGHGFSSMTVVKESDNKYRMWGSTHNGIYNDRIVHMVSTDGITWNNPQVVISRGAEGTYGQQVYSPFVIKVSDSDYRMWYAGYDGSSNWRILYAISEDGVTWTDHQLVIDVNVEGTYDTTYVQCPHVIRRSSTDYRMFYQAYNGSNWVIMYATSENGKDWENHNVVLELLTHPLLDSFTHMYAPIVYYNSSNDIYTLMYTGYDGTYFYQCIAKSYDDCSTWTVADDIMVTTYYSDVNTVTDTTIPHSHSLDWGFAPFKNIIMCYIEEDNHFKFWSKSQPDSIWFNFNYFRTASSFDDFYSPHDVKCNIEDAPIGNTIDEIELLFTNYDVSEIESVDFAVAFLTDDVLETPILKEINYYYSPRTFELNDPENVIQEDSEKGTAIVDEKLQFKNFESGTFICDDLVYANDDISISSGGYYYLFDNLVGTHTSTNSLKTSAYPFTITYDFGEDLSRVIEKYVICLSTNANSVLYYPTDWQFRGSKDGIVWTKLDEQTSFTTWMLNGGNNEFKFDNSTLYRYYKWTFTEGRSTVCALSRLELFERNYSDRLITKLCMACYDDPTLMPNYFQIRAGNTRPTDVGQGTLIQEHDYRTTSGYWSEDEMKVFFIEHDTRYLYYWIDVYSIESTDATSFSIGRLWLYGNGPELIAFSETGGTGGTGGTS